MAILKSFAVCWIFNIITIAEGPYSVERQQVAASITKNVRFEGQLASLSESEKASYLAKLDIPGKAVTRLPEFISSGSQADAERVLGSRGFTLDYADDELNHLTVEKAVMDAALVLEQTRLLASISAPDRRALEECISGVLGRSNAIVRSELGDLIPGELIDRCFDKARIALVGRIDDRTTYWMKCLPNQEKLNTAMAEFERRLKASRDTAASRLKDGNRFDAKGGLPEAKLAELKQREMDRILDEVTSPLLRILRNATAPTMLLELNQDPDQILPGYVDVAQRWTQRRHDVQLAERKRRTEAENKAEQLRRLQMELSAEATRLADRTVQEGLLDTNEKGHEPNRLSRSIPMRGKPAESELGHRVREPGVVPSVAVSGRKMLGIVGLATVGVIVLACVLLRAWSARRSPNQGRKPLVQEAKGSCEATAAGEGGHPASVQDRERPT